MAATEGQWDMSGLEMVRFKWITPVQKTIKIKGKPRAVALVAERRAYMGDGMTHVQGAFRTVAGRTVYRDWIEVDED
jgi:hypothetical protein